MGIIYTSTRITRLEKLLVQKLCEFAVEPKNGKIP